MVALLNGHRHGITLSAWALPCPALWANHHDNAPCAFPGHSSWAGSGLGFFSFWLVGRLQPYSGSGRAQPLQLLLGLLPLGCALAVGCQRFVSNK